MRIATMLILVGLTSHAAHADTQAAETCKASLSPVGQEIYAASIAQHPTPSTGRSIVTGVVEKFMAEGKVGLSEGRKAGKAAGECLKKLE